jgi:LysM domain
MKHQRGHAIFGITAHLGVIFVGSCLLTGCVMSEKYEAEKARSLNFQRLLAQEEKRTSELDSEAKRAKRELAEMEARNRELAAQVDAVRQQAAQIQEEAEAMKEATMLERKAREDMKRMTTPPKPKRQEKPEPAESPKTPMELFGASSDLSRDIPGDLAADLSAQTIHTVQSGETLFRIGLKYHVSVDTLRKWNSLKDNNIEVGQKLVVAQP